MIWRYEYCSYMKMKCASFWNVVSLLLISLLGQWDFPQNHAQIFWKPAFVQWRKKLQRKLTCMLACFLKARESVKIKGYKFSEAKLYYFKWLLICAFIMFLPLRECWLSLNQIVLTQDIFFPRLQKVQFSYNEFMILANLAIWWYI